jgi:hypothetical protein
MRFRLAAVSGLAGAFAAAAGAETVTIALPATQTELTLIEGRDAVRLLAGPRIAAVDANGTAERALIEFCSNGEAQRSVADKGLITEFLGQILSLTLEKAADRIRAEVAKYSALSERSARVDYYRGTPAAGTGHLESRYQCLHFVRVAANAAGGTDVALDVVAGIGLDTARDAVVLRPLRLYVSKAAARSATGHYGVAVSIRADAVWKDATLGHQATVFEQTIASESIDLAGGPFIKYYPTDVMGGHRAPIVPISTDIDRGKDFGRVDFTVSAAEIGTPPATLTLLSQLFPLTTERRARLMIEAAIISNLPVP